METMNHEYYVSPEIAKLLEKVGFDWKCRKCYNKGVLFDMEPDEIRTQTPQHSSYDVLAPTLEVAQRWLREVKNLVISIHYDPTIKSQPYAYSIYDVEEKFDDILGIISPVTHSYSDGYFYKYEEAQEAGIKKAVEILLKEGK